MCRCLQSCWEDCYWHCIEERFCFDEKIAYYNPDEDDAVVGNEKKNALDAEFVGGNRKNSEIIVNQPLARYCSVMGNKAHEDDFQREIQTTVPILAPEVMAAFAQSQIFHEHSQKPKAALARIETKAKITTVDVSGSGTNQDAEKLLSRLEGIAGEEQQQNEQQHGTGSSAVVFKCADEDIVRTRSKEFQPIAEEGTVDDEILDRVDLRLKSYQRQMSASSHTLSPAVHRSRQVPLRLKHVQSVPQFPTTPSRTVSSLSLQAARPWSQAAETMTRDGVFIIPTPEVPAISLRKLPRNYLETPSIDSFPPPSGSLTSIQMQNKQRNEDKFNFQMPRYYGRSEMYLPTPAISQEEINRSNLRAAANKHVRLSLKKNLSMGNLNQRSASPDSKSASTLSMMQVGASSDSQMTSSAESKRLKILRGNLPPLMIQPKHRDTPEKERH